MASLPEADKVHAEKFVETSHKKQRYNLFNFTYVLKRQNKNDSIYRCDVDVSTSTFLQSRSIPTTNEIQRSSSEASVASTESQQNKIQCDFCFATGKIKYFTKRGMTKHHNSAHRPAI